MSISRSFEIKSSQERRTSLPLSERIQLNTRLIREIVEKPPFVPIPSTFNAEKEVLRSQLFSIAARGYSYSLISEAMVVSEIYMKTILKQNTALTESQYQMVIDRCRDLSESSGSSSSQPTLLPPASAPELEASETLETQEKGRPPFGETSSSAMEMPCVLERTSSEQRLIEMLPLKKRKTWRLSFLSEYEQQGKMQSTIITSKDTKSLVSPMISSLNIVLDTVIGKAKKKPPFEVICPKKGVDRKHVCPLCMLAHHVLSSKKSSVLLKQIETLLIHTTKENLLEALSTLITEKKVTPLYDKTQFSRLEMAYLIFQCKVGDALCLPGEKNPAEEAGIYMSMEKVIKDGLKSSLTQTIKTLWESFQPVAEKDLSVLVEEGDNKFQVISSSSLINTFSSLTQRRFSAVTKKELRTPLGPFYANFVAEATIRSLQALKTSPLGSAFLTPTAFQYPAIRKGVTEHVYSLILASHGSWRIEVLPSALSVTPKQTLALLSKDLSLILPSFKNFIVVNSIVKIKELHLVGLEDIGEQKSPESSLHAIEGKQKSQKRKRKIRHVEQEEVEQVSPSQTPISSPLHEPSASISKEEALTALSFLLDFISLNKGRRVSSVDCPSSSEVGHTCSLCVLTKQILRRKAPLLIKQLERLLSYTTKETLINALMNLFSINILTELSERVFLSNIELAYILRDCKIGDEVALPGNQNPARLADMYFTVEKVSSSGLCDPLTKSILEIWKTSPPLSPIKSKEHPTVLAKYEDGSVKVCQKSVLQPLFTHVPHRYFERRGTLITRGKLFNTMSKKHSAFIAKLTLYTLKALENSPLGLPYIVPSSEGASFLWQTIEHVYGVILSSSTAWKVAVLASKISPRTAQDLSFSQEEISEILPALQRFTGINKIFLPGRSIFTKTKTEEESEEED
ncbi:hypothetical protein [Chlamydiifrater volucris]|uniref:hypothetical protein n=1 Tax=Chlamydiifrater volucris TaxID=2681470 RepID=UPI001BCE4434|nr:hypothetical protein [Chlamydiifrater volucris]